MRTAPSADVFVPDGVKTSQYAVVSFFPDIVRGESINLAVVAFGAGAAHWRITDDWDRVEAFAGKRLSDFARVILSALQKESYDELRSRLGHTSVYSSIVFSSAHGNLGPVEECADFMAKRLLGQP